MKIGILGSAPSSLGLAPYKDPAWTFWGCSPGVYGIAPRTEVWFEMHLWEPGQPWFSPEYCAFIRNYPGQVYMSAPCPEVKNCVVYPIEEMEELFGPYFWTSSVAYMMALAITKAPEEIGLWGVDMAATEEYGYQRAGCQYLAMLASLRGIRVTVSPQSDLFVPPPKYGFIEQTHMYLKARARMIELNGRKQACEQAAQAKTQETAFLQGAIDDLTYVVNTWPGIAEERDPTAALSRMRKASPITQAAEAAISAVTADPKKGNGEWRGDAGRDSLEAGLPPT